MRYNNFFKDDENIKEKPNQKNDWLALKKNPWNIFSNYSKTIDKSLTKIHHLKNEYLDNLNKHKNTTVNIQTHQNDYKKFLFECNIGLFLLSLFYTTCSLILFGATINLIISLIPFFFLIIPLSFYEKKTKKTTAQKNNQG